MSRNRKKFSNLRLYYAYIEKKICAKIKMQRAVLVNVSPVAITHAENFCWQKLKYLTYLRK